jgi:hypothetical protein
MRALSCWDLLHCTVPSLSLPCAMLCHAVLCRYHAVNGAVGQQMYREMVQPVIDRFCQGYNGCILAYGQTGELLLLLMVHILIGSWRCRMGSME